MHRKLIVLHTVLAAFFFPMGIMYAITGGLYGLGVKGSYTTTEHRVTLDQPLTPELSTLTGIVERELAARGIDTPTGNAGVKKGGTSYFLEWTGTRRDVLLQPTADPQVATLQVKETNPHRFFVQLHKAKGGEWFKWFAAMWMVGLVLLFLSGGLMALNLRPYRRMTVVTMSLGFATFIALALLS